MAAEIKVGKAGIETVTATITNGTSLSAAVNLGSRRLVAIQMPAAMTGTALTFQASWDGTTYNNVYDQGGTELQYTTAASRYIVVTSNDLLWGIQFIKVRSGTSGAATNEGADRTLTLILQP